MPRRSSVLLCSSAGFFFPSPAISSLRAVDFCPDRSNPRTKSPRKARVFAALLAGLCLGAFAAHGQETWAPPNPGGNQSWTDPTNWIPQVVPTGTALLGVPPTVGTIIGNNPSINANTNAEVGEIRFGNPTSNYSIGISGTLTITGVGITNLSTIHQVIVPLSGGTLTFDNGSTAGDSTIGYSNRGGVIVFNNNSTAGSAGFENQQSPPPPFGTNSIGTITFNDTSTAGTAVITNNSGTATITFAGESTAGSASITNGGGSNPSGTRNIIFTDTSNAETAKIENGSANCIITFQGDSKAGSATIDNALSAVGGTINFKDSSDAEGATITNFNATGTINFQDLSKAGSAIISNSAGGGTINFLDSSSAENATITTNSGGIINFENTSNAGSAMITTNSGGTTDFFNTSTAGNSNITTSSDGVTTFHDSAIGGTATLTIDSGGIVNFRDTSSAQNATLNNSGGSTAEFRGGLNFFNTSTAGNATINTESGAITTFKGMSNAGTSTITNSGKTSFHSSASADQAKITNNAKLNFQDTSSAGGSFVNVTNFTNGATITTNDGGVTSFFGASTGGVARFITNTGGKVDISSLTTDGMTSGSIEGAGNYLLGSKELTTGLNNLDTEVSGVISDGGDGGGTGGSLIKAGLGTLTLTGENTYTGDTTISGGTLQLGNGGTAGSISTSSNVVLDGGTLTFNHSGSTKNFFPNLITGNGNVVKLGSDFLEVTGINNYTGNTFINNGVYIAGGGLTVAGQGLTSFALGNSNVFLNNATLRAPTLDPEVINVGGNYTQSSSGTLQLGVAGILGRNYDRVQAGGTATVAGTLSVFSLGGFAPANGNAFAVVRGAAGRTGTYGTINDFLNLNHLQRVDIYARNAVILLYLTPTVPPVEPPSPPPVIPPPPTPGPTPAPTPGPKPPPAPPPINEEAPNVVVPPVNPNEPLPLPDVVLLVDPNVEQLTSLYEISFSGANTQRFSLDARMLELQQTIFPSPPIQEVTKELTKEGKEQVPPPAPPPVPRWALWGSGYGDWVRLDNTDNANGYNFTTGGMTAGIDYLITDHFAVGLFGGYAHTGANLTPSGSIDVNTGRGGIYATYFSHDWWVNAAAWGGGNSYSTSRHALVGTANGDTNGWELSTFGEAGYNFHPATRLPTLSIGPTVALQFSRVGYDGFTEHGSLVPLNIHSGNQNSLRSDVGIQGSYSFHIGNIPVTPYFRAVWEYESKYSALPISYGADLFPGVSITTTGPKEGRSSAIVIPGIGVQWTPRWSSFIEYQGQLGRSNYDSNGVQGGISWSF